MTTVNPMAPEKKRSDEKTWWKKSFHYQLLFPALLLLVLIEVYPILYTLRSNRLSPQRWKVKMGWGG